MLAEAVASGRIQGLGARLAALLEYATKLTRSPESVTRADVERLRAAGLDDRGIVDANQVVAYFNYVNRVADGLGVELEQEWPEAVRRERGYWHTVAGGSLPWLELEQMRALDRVAIEEFGVTLERMMENAGRHLADLARRLLGGRVAGRHVVVLAGPGGNGGGGLVAARHLAGGGADVGVVLARPVERLAAVTGAQYRILAAAGLEIAAAPPPRDADLVLDALLGYSQSGPPVGAVESLIAWASGRRVVSLDVPSGLELGNGYLHDPHVRAEATLTLAAPKGALAGAAAAGTLFLADIGIPAAAFARAGIAWESPFAAGPLVRVLAD